MEFRDELPLMVYDDKCYVCIKFARLMNFIARGRLRMIGHYTEFGKNIREEILEEEDGPINTESFRMEHGMGEFAEGHTGDYSDGPRDFSQY